MAKSKKKTNRVSKVISKKTTGDKFSSKAIPSFELFEAINTPILVFDLKSKRPTYCNSAFEQFSGFSLSAVKKQSLASLFAKSESKRIDAIGELLFSSSGEVAEMDLEFKKKTGRKISVNIFAKSMESKNNFKSLVVAFHDTTYQNQLQKEKEQAMREITHVSKLADIGRLAAGVAHELNNPLMIIQGFAENIELSAEKGNLDLKELRWQLNPIFKATGRMTKIISQLTRMARENDNAELVTTNLSEVVENILAFAKNQIVYNDIDLEKQFNRDLIVKCDPSQIEQIVVNIVNNAVHALSKRENDKRLLVDIFESDDGINLSIHNNGPEIPEDIKDKVMTPFFTTKEVGEGTGLGLSVSYGIMKAHGGDLTFESRKGFGTKFYLHFPKVEVALAEPRKVTGVGIVVDDEKYAREIVANKLKNFGFKIYQAANGVEALKILTKHPEISFVFTDAKMPKMDGATLVKEIRSTEKSMFIFAVTGYTGISSIEKEISQHGITAFLAKPLDHEKFSECIGLIENFLTDKKIAS